MRRHTGLYAQCWEAWAARGAGSPAVNLETAKGSYGLTGNDVFEPAHKATLSIWKATVIGVEAGSS